jgi:hypothetical protein
VRLERTAVTALLLAALLAEGVAAQATAMPTFFAPTRGFGSWEMGVTLSRPGGGATGLEARYGAALDRADLALRAGYVEPGRAGDGTFAAGIEARVPVLGRTPTFPLDGALILGAGRTLDPGQTIVPIGLTLGRRILLDGPALHLTPYAQPTVVFASDALFTLGLGVDVHIRGIPNIRVAWALADLDGFSVGAFWPR